MLLVASKDNESEYRLNTSKLFIHVLLHDSKWAPRLKVSSFYYGCLLRYRENSLHLDASVVNN